MARTLFALLAGASIADEVPVMVHVIALGHQGARGGTQENCLDFALALSTWGKRLLAPDLSGGRLGPAA